jgi:hypothetical protein
MLKGRDLRRAAVTTPGVMTEERFQRLAELAATAMDGSSGMAFVGAALELIRPGLIEPLSVVTHPRDITVTFGGGFVEYLSAYAADYGSVGFNQYGLQGTNNTDIPQVQVTVDKGTWKAVIWAASSSISDIDMKKLAAATASGQGAPFSLQKLIDTGVRLVWNKALDKVTYPDVVATLAPATGAGGLRTWASKTPQQIQTDINFGLLAGVKASGYSLEGLPDTLLVDWDDYNLLTAPYVLGGIGGAASILEYVMKNNIASKNGVDFKVLPLSNPWIDGIGTGGTNRAFFYRNSEDNVKLHVPAPMAPAMTVPSVKDGGSYETMWNGCIAQVQWFRPQTASYLDGI